LTEYELNVVKGGTKMTRMTILAGLAAAVAFVSGSAGAGEFDFKLHHLLPSKAPAQTQMLEPWERAVEENSGGRIDIEIFPAMSLGGTPPELVQQARDGVVDLIWTVNGYTPGLFPRTEVFELPFIHTNDSRATNLAMQEMFADDLAPEYGDLEVMFLHVHAGHGLQMVDKLVRSPADLEGTKLRTPSRTGAWIIEALGAAPAAMPVPELPQALAKKVVDGALIPWEIIPPLKLQDQTQYQIEGADNTRFGTIVFQVSMNKDRWDSLPPEIQQAFKDASGPEWWGEVGDIWVASDEVGIKVATDAGNQHVVLTAEETEAFREALQPVVDRWIEDVSGKGIDGAALVDKARTLIEKHASN
jgi:TRAP-type C4-dicarboxylate transport system substrate-binding protein